MSKDTKIALILLVLFSAAVAAIGVSTGWDFSSPTQTEDHAEAIEESLR